MADEPPPIIKVGPANQTLPINTLALLPCEASGSPSPSVSWMKNVEPISGLQYDPRITISDPGSLRIESKKKISVSQRNINLFIFSSLKSSNQNIRQLDFDTQTELEPELSFKAVLSFQA